MILFNNCPICNDEFTQETVYDGIQNYSCGYSVESENKDHIVELMFNTYEPSCEFIGFNIQYKNYKYELYTKESVYNGIIEVIISNGNNSIHKFKKYKDCSIDYYLKNYINNLVFL